jgi:hypothetical protein
MRTTIAALFLIGFVLPEACGRRPQPTYYRGPLCGDFLASSGKQRDIYNSWVLGFVAANNRERPKRQVTLSQGETEQRTAAYCADHPLDPMAEAAFTLVDSVTPER